MSATVIRSSEEFLQQIKELAVKSPAMPAVAQAEPSFAPLTLEQVNAKLDEFSLALEGQLPDPVREEIERRRAELVKEQFRLRVGYLPDADGNNPAEMKAIVDAATESATKSVIETLTAAPESEGTPDVEVEEDADVDLVEQEKILNKLDEADSVTTVSAQQAPVIFVGDSVTLSSEIVGLLRAALRANLTHTVLRVLSVALQEK
jgi:hypothetical protein